jgi:hypothetical protein
VLAPVGQHVSGFDVVRDDSEAAFAECAAGFGQFGRFWRGGLDVGVGWQRGDLDGLPTGFGDGEVQIFEELSLVGELAAGVEQLLRQ